MKPTPKKLKFPKELNAIVSIFCDVAALSPSLSTYPEQLSHPKVFGAFGIHPHK
jgi:hypothetical protein